MEPRLSYVIGRLDRVLRRRLGAALEPAGLTLPAYTALSVLRDRDGLSNAQLARRSLDRSPVDERGARPARREGRRAASLTMMALATRLADHLDRDSDGYLAVSA